jgi:hypothetical protein
MSATTVTTTPSDIDDCIGMLDEAHTLARACNRAIGGAPEGADARALLAMLSSKVVEARDGLLALPAGDAPSGPAWAAPGAGA